MRTITLGMAAEQSRARDLPLISVAIPSYNYARYITTAIDSVLAQSYPNVEIVVTDNGSTDDTSAVVAGRYRGDARVRFSVNQTNLGIVGNFNAALAAASGDFVQFLSADDWLLPEHLARLADVLLRHPEVDLVYSGVYFADARERIFGVRAERSQLTFDYIDIRDELPEMLTGVPPLCLPAALFRRALFSELGPMDPGVPIAADWELAVRFAAAGKRFAYLWEPSCVVRVHDENASGLEFNRSGQIVADMIAIFEKYIDHPSMARLRGREREALGYLRGNYDYNRRTFGGAFFTPELEARCTAICEKLAAAAARYEPARVREGTISVVMAAAGPPESTIRAIDSVAAQVAANWQIVVVDQGSLPLRHRLRAHPAWERIAYARLPSRVPVGAALNLGVRLARGEYLAFLDSDERYAPGHLDGLCAAVARTGCEVVASSARLVVERSNAHYTDFEYLQSVEGLFRGPNDSPAMAVFANALPLGAILHHRRVFGMAGGFDENALLLEDFDYLSRLQSVARIAVVEPATLDVHVRLGLSGQKLGAFGLHRYAAALEALYAARDVEPAFEPYRTAQRVAIAGLAERFDELVGTPEGLIEVYATLAGRRLGAPAKS